MIASSVKFRGHRCFRGDWSGFDQVMPVNVIIGRNNTGKSHLLDLAEAICDRKFYADGWQFQCQGKLDEDSLRRVFIKGHSSSELRGDFWDNHGVYFVDKKAVWETDERGNVTTLNLLDEGDTLLPHGQRHAAARHDLLLKVLKEARHVFSGLSFRRLLADRDIRPEPAVNALALAPNGEGATNIIRRYIVSSSSKLPRELVQKDLLSALNRIFAGDGVFTELEVQIHDEGDSGYPENVWEIFLGENTKGLISLSRSGSGLKTVILVLLNLLVVPQIEGKAKSDYIFAFEELENNLHPSLLRRLLQYIEEYALAEKATIFLTTHSSTALDLFGVSKNAQIIHVTHDGEAARATTVSAHFDHLHVISELGAKPSDLLQANGIIWVEGPSDCIYINKWLELYSGSRIQEGRDYQCAFYGGSLLARTQFKTPEEAEKDLVNLFRINPNIIVVCDGDRQAKGARVKDRVRRIRAEVRKIPNAHIWVTAGREIENYIPGVVVAQALGLATLPDPTQYEAFFPRKRSAGVSYVEKRIRRKGIDKMELAVLSVGLMDKPMMQTRFDWESQMKQIIERIDSWNR